ncbi:response regulator [Phaeocystidibacter marisrubri]|uniref:Response regulator transcription factor n=1 Tax=Phaeocystidibacter marisrubri TaxID=1577780 RepID=A0A6L3ZKP8_9FLAO|nr:response regulator transcription factor [Phaeocystidibacter marisrubri]KAB2818118.1 response regulator transcription factor [Phaeocystidibacter marisrubri]GGH71862.1 DNA-binding response regulator [Phaeocystidibacter marisrubri]
MNTRKKRLAVLEDHLIVVEGMRHHLEDWGFKVLDHYSCGNDFLNALKRGESYDLLIMDLGIPNTNTENLIVRLRRDYSWLKVLILTGLSHSSTLTRYMNMGASGFVGKMAGNDELALAIRLVLNGEKYIDSRLSVNNFSHTEDPFERLTPREIQVFKLLILGKSYRDIAVELFIEVNTVGSFRTRIARKLGADSINDLRLIAAQYGQI